MARKAIDILKSQGFTDADIAEMNITPKYAAALEKADSAAEKLQADLDATTVWYHNEAVPTLNKALADATEARGEAAKVNARLKSMQDYGLARVADDQDNKNKGGGGADDKGDKGNRGTPTDFDPNKFVSADTFLQTTDRFGEAIAVATDIAEDHRDLFGSRLPGGVTGLRKEYQDAVKNHRFNGDLRMFWESKFNVQQKQTERSVAAHQKELDDYAAEKVNAVRSEMMNPMTRTMSVSRNPFVAKAVTGADGNKTVTGKQPWEDGRTVEQRRSERVVRFAQKATA